METTENQEEAVKLLNEAYKCKPGDLEILLQKIEYEIEKRGYADSILLRAKTVVTSKMALNNK